MPELPEVETIRRILTNGSPDSPSLPGRRINAVSLFNPGSLADPAPDVFTSFLIGRKIETLGRRSKFLLIGLDEGTLLFHLRMSGNLFVEPELSSEYDSPPPRPHDRLHVHLDNQSRLVFNDTRKFGRFWLAANPASVLSKLGPEPFDPALTEEQFFRRLRKHKRQLKPLLMDQSFLAGLGNIYTDEALFRAGLHPLTLSNRVTASQARLLLKSIRETLQAGIDHNGSSIDWVYGGGNFQNYFNVYQQSGKPCPQCGQPIERIVVGQRGTHFCPLCQPYLREET